MMDASEASAISSSLFSPWNLYRAPEATTHIPALGVKTGRPSDHSYLSLGGKYCRSSDQETISRFSLKVLDDVTLLVIEFCTPRHWLKMSIQDKHTCDWHVHPLTLAKLFASTLSDLRLHCPPNWTHFLRTHPESRHQGIKTEGKRGEKILAALLFTSPSSGLTLAPPKSPSFSYKNIFTSNSKINQTSLEPLHILICTLSCLRCFILLKKVLN